MVYGDYFKDKTDSIPDYRKIITSIILFEKEKDLLGECGFLKKDINRLSLELENILLEQNGNLPRL